ncbi:MAG TPA: Hsp20 family protein, partial [Stellaceae bacterium]|nr:Hsp20 family protein [Stellaceae bacterium]
MDRFDFSPLFRSTIGFDRLTRLVDAATSVDSAALAYPPYNIEKTGEDAYRLTMAVAGFSPAELNITVQENTLLVTGKAQSDVAIHFWQNFNCASVANMARSNGLGCHAVLSPPTPSAFSST